MPYRIWHTGEGRSLRVERIPEIYPEGSLTAIVEADNTISVRCQSNGLLILSKLPYLRYARYDGSGFVNHVECKQYLDEEFAKKYVADGIDWQSNEW